MADFLVNYPFKQKSKQTSDPVGIKIILQLSSKLDFTPLHKIIHSFKAREKIKTSIHEK